MITVEMALQEYLETLEAIGRSEHTVRQYRSILRPIAEILFDMPIDTIEARIIRAHIINLRTRHPYQSAVQRPREPGTLANETVRTHVTILKTFFNWCQRQYGLAPHQNPMRNLPRPPRDEQQPRAIPLDDLRKLFNAADDGTVIGKRNVAILAFLTDTGCRANETVTLLRANLFPDKRWALVKGKGNKLRAVPLSADAIEVINGWLAACPVHTDTVFCSLGSTHWGTPMTPGGLYQMIERLAQKASVHGPYHPHSFRHRFAMYFLSRGGNQITLSQLMGHSDVSVTARYAVYPDPELVEQHKSPLKGMRR